MTTHIITITRSQPDGTQADVVSLRVDANREPGRVDGVTWATGSTGTAPAEDLVLIGQALGRLLAAARPPVRRACPRRVSPRRRGRT